MYDTTLLSKAKTHRHRFDKRSISESSEDEVLDYSNKFEEYPTFQLGGDELFGIVINTMCQFTQEIATFPIHNIYISSQILNNSYPSYYFPWSVANSLYSSYVMGGGSLLWRGFPSYIILNGSLSVGDTLLCYTTHKYLSNRWLSRPLIFLERCIANFIIAPFYTTMMVDCVMSDSVTGLRNPLFFILEGSKLLFSRRNYRYRNSVFSYLSSRPLSLYNRYITYIMMVFGRFIVGNVVCRMYSYWYGRRRTNAAIHTINNEPVFDNMVVDVGLKNDDTTEQCLDRVENQIEFISDCCDKLTVDLLTTITSDLLMMPIVTSGIRCLLQGLDLFVDGGVHSTSQTLDILNANVIPASHTYFRDIFECITTTYDDYGFVSGFCKGIGAIVLGSLIKYGIVELFKKVLQFYRRSNRNLLSTSLSYYEE